MHHGVYRRAVAVRREDGHYVGRRTAARALSSGRSGPGVTMGVSDVVPPSRPGSFRSKESAPAVSASRIAPGEASGAVLASIPRS